MNNRTDNFRGEILGTLLTLVLGATGALTAAEAAKPAVATAVPAVEAVQTAEGTDVISLDALLDDSADERKKAPKIRIAPPSEADTKVDEKSVPEQPVAATDAPKSDAQPTEAKEASKADAPVAAADAPKADAQPAKEKEESKVDEPPPVAAKVAPKNGEKSATKARKNTFDEFFGTGPVDESTLVDVICDEAPLADVLAQFRRITGANIISVESSNLNQRVSATLNHVPWKEALQAILNAKKFRLESRKGIDYVSEEKQVIPEFTRTFRLNHASATELATLFNTTLGGMPLDPKTGKPMTVVSGGKPVGKQIATAFDGANVVVVTATEKILTDCETIIAAVDKAIPQIYIEARFIEISNEALHKLGVQWNQLESWGATVKGLAGGMEYNNGRAGVYDYRTRTGSSSSTVSSTGSAASDGTRSSSASGSYTSTKGTAMGSLVADSISAASGAGRTAENMNWLNARGFSGQLSADDFSLALSAFESMTDAKIFSNPKVIVSNGKEAKVDMTTKFPHVKVTSQRNNTGNESYVDMATEMQVIPGEDPMMFAKEAFFSWGITLSVKPRISPDGLISVEIVPTISQLDTDVTASGFYEIASDAGSGLYPIIKMKRLITDFTMKDGATAVIGGLSKTEEEDIDSGIPYLRKIPYIGPKLFGWKSRGKVQKEIIVFVTLGIADPADLPRDIGLPQNAVSGREYVNGTKLEPGLRGGGVSGLMTFDTRSLEDQRKENQGDMTGEGSVPVPSSGKGSVTIRVVKPNEN